MMQLLLKLISCISVVQATLVQLDSRLIWKFTNDSSQIINTIIYDTKMYTTGIVYSDKRKTLTSFANNTETLVAINGGYFDFDPNTNYSGGVTKLRINNQDIVTANLINDTTYTSAVLAIKENGRVYILNSLNPRAQLYPTFLFSGPLLLYNYKVQNFENTKWNNAKNPRTVICTTKKSNVVKFIVIDGRYPGAEGMTIPELANYLYTVGCKNAINLDGGGSSSLYIKGLGIVNNAVKRSISNAIIIS